VSCSHLLISVSEGASITAVAGCRVAIGVAKGNDREDCMDNEPGDRYEKGGRAIKRANRSALLYMQLVT